MCGLESAVPEVGDAAFRGHVFSYLLPGASGGVEVGKFRYTVEDDCWTWSPETYAIHGFKPEEVVPSTNLVLAHKHPDDRKAFEELFRALTTRGGSLVSHHRILDARGRTRKVLMVAQSVGG